MITTNLHTRLYVLAARPSPHNPSISLSRPALRGLAQYETCDAHMTTLELNWNCRDVDMPVVKVKVPSDDEARAVWAFLKVKGRKLGLEIPYLAEFTIRFECSTGEGMVYDRFRADPPFQHLKEIIENVDWKDALTGQGLRESEVVKLFVVENRPLEEDEEVEVENGDDWIREYNQMVKELEEAEEIAATWPSKA